MKFRIEIELSEESFEGYAAGVELARILRDLALNVQHSTGQVLERARMPVRDTKMRLLGWAEGSASENNPY